MKVFKTKPFSYFMKQEGIEDHSLVDAVKRAEKGLIDADLGGGVIKQRLTRKGQGKSSGYRTIILYKAKMKVFFVYGFAKNERDNINQKELRAFKKLASSMMNYTDAEIKEAIKFKELFEVKCDEKE